MNTYDIRDTFWNQYQFWAVAAPITLFIVGFVLIVAFKREWLTGAAFKRKWLARVASSGNSLPYATATPHQSGMLSLEIRPSIDTESQNSAQTLRSRGWVWALPFMKTGKKSP